MLSVLENPAIRARVAAVSVEHYHRMFELGMLAPKIELIRGALIEPIPKSPLHAFIVELLREYLTVRLPQGYFLRQEQPLTLNDSEPEPDLAVIRGARPDFLAAHPATAELIIEVAVSSEALDRLKLQIYAEAGVEECWLVLADERVIERHTEPHGAAYRRIERTVAPASLESTVCPGLSLPPAGLFPG
ncbi:MAG: Uma2 family endonuclease [Verrucomicrobia bacterium]|nr:MAG: Uma2 family endonuclease [Verrucomicrobiota bacterium]